jgi:hypothetical protein
MSTPMRLHQLLAVEKDTKNEVLRVVTDFYQRIAKGPLLSGISRRYRPVTEDGEKLPPESTIVQLRVEESLPEVQKALTALFDTILAKEDANQSAKADIVVDGTVVMAGVPVCALLFLEKQVTDLVTLIDKLPVLDPSERWVLDSAQNCWATVPVETHRTKKIPRPFIKAPATDKHAAQVEVVHEDEVVGYWNTTKFSGAIPADRKAALKARASKLREAIKIAREDANTVRVGDRKMGAAILGYLFA